MTSSHRCICSFCVNLVMPPNNYSLACSSSCFKYICFFQGELGICTEPDNSQIASLKNVINEGKEIFCWIIVKLSFLVSLHFI